MTTPEKLRRRQRVEGAFLVFLALFTLGYGVWDSKQNERQDQCMADQFRQASEAQAVRAELAEEQTALGLKVDDNQDRLVRELAASQSREESLLALTKFQRTNARLNEDEAALLEKRKNTPIPEFPEGTCQK